QAALDPLRTHPPNSRSSTDSIVQGPASSALSWFAYGRRRHTRLSRASSELASASAPSTRTEPPSRDQVQAAAPMARGASSPPPVARSVGGVATLNVNMVPSRLANQAPQRAPARSTIGSG